MCNRENKGWRRAPDGRDRMLREPVISELVERFGGWEER
jgi:hypothetical protein